MADETNTNEQIEIAKRLQMLWLKHMERMLTSDPPTITSTDMATLAKVLRDNGWMLDEAKLPQRLKDKITKTVDPDDLRDARILRAV